MKHVAQILMIDDSPIIDRRVLMEAQALMAAGYQVSFVCPAKNQSEVGRGLVQGVDCFRVLVSADAENIHRSQPNETPGPSSGFKRWLKQWPMLFHVAREIYRFPLHFYYRFHELPKLLDALSSVRKGRGKEHFLKMDVAQQKMFDFVVENFSSIEVIHAHDLSILNAAVALKQKFTSRLVFDAHEVYGLQYRRNDPLRYFYNLKEKYLIGFADAVITVNADCVRLIQKNVGSKSAAFYEVSNAVELPNDFREKRLAKKGILRNYAGLHGDEKILIFTGGINKLRKVHLLVEAMKFVDREIHLFLMPLPFQIKEFKELAKTHGVGDRVHFGPFVDSEEVLYWISDADVGIMPYQPVVESIAVSSPNKMFEFIACGLPMIGSTQLKNVRAAIVENEAGVCLKLISAGDYARAINLMFDPKLGGQQRFVAAVERIQPKFSWATQVPALLDCYRSLIGPARFMATEKNPTVSP